MNSKLVKLEAAQAQIQGTLRGLVEQMGTLQATIERDRDGKQSAEVTRQALDRMRSEILGAMATKQTEGAKPVYVHSKQSANETRQELDAIKSAIGAKASN